MRLLTLAILLSLIAPEPSVSDPPRSSEIPAAQLQQISKLLAAADRALQEGDYKTGADLDKEALRLAVSLEPELLHPMGSVNEQQARADLLFDLGRAADSLGRDALALRYYESSLKLFQETSGHEEPKVADVLMELADLHLTHGRRDLWQRLLDRALEIRIDTYGPHHPDVAWIWTLRGYQAKADGDLEASEEYFRRAVAALEASQPPTDEDLGRAYRALARVLEDAGKPDEAAHFKGKYRRIRDQN